MASLSPQASRSRVGAYAPGSIAAVGASHAGGVRRRDEDPSQFRGRMDSLKAASGQPNQTYGDQNFRAPTAIAPGATRQDRIIASRMDGTFDTKRNTFNAGNTNVQMDESGNIAPRAIAPVSPPLTPNISPPGRKYVVGEQGPEMFVPQRPGTIVPINPLDRHVNRLNARGDKQLADNADHYSGLEKDYADMAKDYQGMMLSYQETRGQHKPGTPEYEAANKSQNEMYDQFVDKVGTQEGFARDAAKNRGLIGTGQGWKDHVTTDAWSQRRAEAAMAAMRERSMATPGSPRFTGPMMPPAGGGQPQMPQMPQPPSTRLQQAQQQNAIAGQNQRELAAKFNPPVPQGMPMMPADPAAGLFNQPRAVTPVTPPVTPQVTPQSVTPSVTPRAPVTPPRVTPRAPVTPPSVTPSVTPPAPSAVPYAAKPSGANFGLTRAVAPGSPSPQAAPPQSPAPSVTPPKPGFFAQRAAANPNGVISKVAQATGMLKNSIATGAQNVGSAVSSVGNAVSSVGNAAKSAVAPIAQSQSKKNPGGLFARMLAPTAAPIGARLGATKPRAVMPLSFALGR